MEQVGQSMVKDTQSYNIATYQRNGSMNHQVPTSAPDFHVVHTILETGWDKEDHALASESHLPESLGFPHKAGDFRLPTTMLRVNGLPAMVDSAFVEFPSHCHIPVQDCCEI